MQTYYQLIVNSTNVSEPYGNLADVFPQLYDRIIKLSRSINSCNLSMGDLKTMLRGVTIESVYLSVPITNYTIEYDNGLVMYNEHCVIRVTSLFPQLVVFDKLLADLVKDTKTCTVARSPTADPSNKPWRSRSPDPSPPPPNKPKPWKPQSSVPKRPTKSVLPEPIVDEKPPKLGLKSRQQQIPKKPLTSVLPQPVANERPVEKDLAKDEKKNHKMTEADELFELEKEKKRNEVIEQNRENEKYRIFENDKKAFVQIIKDVNDGLLSQDDIHPCFVAKYVVFSILKGRDCINFENNNNLKEEYGIFMDLFQNLEYEDPESGQASSSVHIPHNYLFMSDAEKAECAERNNMTREELESHITKISSGSFDAIFA